MTWNFVGYEEDECGCVYAVDVRDSGERVRVRVDTCYLCFGGPVESGPAVDRGRIEAWARSQRATLIGRAYDMTDDHDVEALVDWIETAVEDSGCVKAET